LESLNDIVSIMMVPTMRVVQHFNAPVVYSVSGTECLDDSDDEDSVYVLSDFEGEIFQQLCNNYSRVVAPPVVIWAAANGEVS